MRTAHLLPISYSIHSAGGVCSGGVPGPGGAWSWGVSGPGGCLPLVPGDPASGPGGGGVSQQAMGQTLPCEQNQTHVKT